jgi:predicted HAD superfamily Cof-like phosphohydrolase
VALRLALIDEELTELRAAIGIGDVVAVADALADLLYVTYGAAITFGIDVRPIFEEVHRANMAKLGGGTRADGKVLKPHGWQPPDLAPLLEQMRLSE